MNRALRGVVCDYFPNCSNRINLRLPSHGGLYAWEFEKGQRKLNVHVDGQLVLNSAPQMVSAALAGFGLAYVPQGMVETELAAGRLRRVLEDGCPPSSGYHLYYPSRRHSSPAFARGRGAALHRA